MYATQQEKLRAHGQSIRDTMAGGGDKKTYGPPKIPDTPSKAINDMLQTRCGSAYANPVKAGIAHYICLVFQAITTVYNTIDKEKARPSHTMWMVACGIISVVIVAKVYLIYSIVMASAFVMKALLYYGAIGLSLFGVGLGVAGMVFFDKEGDSGTGRSNFKARMESATSAAASSVKAPRFQQYSGESLYPDPKAE